VTWWDRCFGVVVVVVGNIFIFIFVYSVSIHFGSQASKHAGRPAAKVQRWQRIE